MNKQSFIGDMWKAAVEIKCNYENSKNIDHVEILQRHVGGKYSYLILRVFDELDNASVLLSSDILADMSMKCEYYESTFNVRCNYFFLKDTHTDKLYTGMIVN